MPRTPIAERISILEASPEVAEIARYEVHGLTLRVYSSLEKHPLDDTHSPKPLPPYVELPVLQLTIGCESLHATEAIRLIIHVSGYEGQKTEEISVSPMEPGHFIGRVYRPGFEVLEVIDWWLERLPEQRSTC